MWQQSFINNMSSPDAYNIFTKMIIDSALLIKKKVFRLLVDCRTINCNKII